MVKSFSCCSLISISFSLSTEMEKCTFSFVLFQNVGPGPLLHHVLWEVSSISTICLILYMFGFLCAVFNNYRDAYSGMSEICVWSEVSPLLPSAHYTEYLIHFSNHHAWGFGNTVKKDVRRSWEERWREIAGERRPLINRSARQLSGSHSSLSWNTLSLSLASCCSHSPWICLLLSDSSIHPDLQHADCALYSCLCSVCHEWKCSKWPKVFRTVVLIRLKEPTLNLPVLVSLNGITYFGLSGREHCGTGLAGDYSSLISRVPGHAISHSTVTLWWWAAESGRLSPAWQFTGRLVWETVLPLSTEAHREASTKVPGAELLLQASSRLWISLISLRLNRISDHRAWQDIRSHRGIKSDLIGW